MTQITIDDIQRAQELESQPGRTAYIDECGNFGFDFGSDGVSTHYVLCAVVVRNSELPRLHQQVLSVKKNNGFEGTEMKSSSIGNNFGRRNKIIAELLPIEFKLFVFVVDKQALVDDSPLKSYRHTFIKYLHQRLYSALYTPYPKLKIVEDQIGTSEFQQSFKRYVHEHSPRNLLNEYEFEYTDSKDSLLVQLADIIGGTIAKKYSDPSAPNYIEMLQGKIMYHYLFPERHNPYFGSATGLSAKYDKPVFDLALHRARSFVSAHKNDEEGDTRLQVALLQYLLFHVLNVNAGEYISSYRILSVLEEYSSHRIRSNYLYRRVIAPLRDASVILASCSKGYKIPVSADDIMTYFNQTHMIVSPMLHRMQICRDLIKQQTNNELDVLDDPAFLKYKGYFD